jgi:hypothetical protein
MKRETFFFQTSPISTAYSGYGWKKMSTYADYRGWVISTIAGRMEVTADSQHEHLPIQAEF